VTDKRRIRFNLFVLLVAGGAVLVLVLQGRFKDRVSAAVAQTQEPKAADAIYSPIRAN